MDGRALTEKYRLDFLASIENGYLVGKLFWLTRGDGAKSDGVINDQ